MNFLLAAFALGVGLGLCLAAVANGTPLRQLWRPSVLMKILFGGKPKEVVPSLTAKSALFDAQWVYPTDATGEYTEVCGHIYRWGTSYSSKAGWAPYNADVATPFGLYYVHMDEQPVAGAFMRLRVYRTSHYRYSCPLAKVLSMTITAEDEDED